MNQLGDIPLPVRVHAHGDHPDFHPSNAFMDVFLDGEQIHDAVFADTERGIVEVYSRSGDSFVTGEDGRLATEIKVGVVRLAWKYAGALVTDEPLAGAGEAIQMPNPDGSPMLPPVMKLEIAIPVA